MKCKYCIIRHKGFLISVKPEFFGWICGMEGRPSSEMLQIAVILGKLIAVCKHRGLLKGELYRECHHGLKSIKD